MDNKRERQKKIITAVIQNSNQTKESTDISLTFEMGNDFTNELYPIGTSARFIYDVGKGYFTFYDESIFDITGFYSNEIVFADPVNFIMDLVVDEHLNIVLELTKKAFSLCKNFHDSVSFAANLEYNIKSKDGKIKRVLNQFTTVYFEEDGFPKINRGRMTDISHLKQDGIPILYIIADNKLVFFEKGNPQLMISSENIIFSKKEIEVLKLLSEGFALKEIAGILKCSIATIYTHKKNIKFKSQLDMNKVITNLKEKGII